MLTRIIQTNNSIRQITWETYSRSAVHLVFMKTEDFRFQIRPLFWETTEYYPLQGHYNIQKYIWSVPR
jgi:hypothetical protein